MMLPLLLAGMTVDAWGRSPADIAREYASQRVAPEVQLDARPIRWAGGTLVRVAPRVKGLRVEGASLLVSVSSNGRVRGSSGRLISARPPPRVVPPGSREAAVAAARRVADRLGQGALWEPRAELVWWSGGRDLALAWRVDVSTARPMATWVVYVSASAARVLSTQRTSATLDEAWIYPGNPVTSELEQVVLPGLMGSVTLDGSHARALSCADAAVASSLVGATSCEVVEQQALADEQGDFLYDPNPGDVDDPLAEVQVYYHTDRIARWLDDRYGFAHPDPIQAIVNFEMANAFYGDFDGDGTPDLAFGNTGSGVDFGYDADVVYHEFGHSVVATNADLPFLLADTMGLDWTAGAVHEGAADLFSMILTRDPLMGEYAGQGVGREAIRDLEADRRCPDDLRGEVHRDGEIFGSLGWNLLTDPRLDPDTVGDLLYGVIPRWGMDIDWPRVGASLRDTADELLAEGVLSQAGHEAVVEHLATSNLESCERVIPLDDGRRPEMFLVHSELPGELSRVPMGAQFSLSLPEGATAAWFDVEAPEGVPWTVYARGREPVEHVPFVLPDLGLGTAVADVYDLAVEGEGEGTLRLDARGSPALVGGETLYFAVSSRAVGSADPEDAFRFDRVTVGARVSTAQDGAAFTSGTCSAAPGRATGGLMVGMAWVVGRRRR